MLAQLFSARTPEPSQLVVSFARGGCDAVSRSTLEENDESVTVTIELRRLQQDPGGEEVDCRDIAQVDTVALLLKAPLAGRRILDPDGRAVALS